MHTQHTFKTLYPFADHVDRFAQDELFLHLFEQYGDVTFLLLLCGYKGNGKTVRTERAMAVFPPNWVTAGGPASARAGMNGTLPLTQTLEHMLLPSIQTRFNVESQWNWVHITELACVFLLSTQRWILKDFSLQQRINAKCNLR